MRFLLKKDVFLWHDYVFFFLLNKYMLICETFSISKLSSKSHFWVLSGIVSLPLSLPSIFSFLKKIFLSMVLSSRVHACVILSAVYLAISLVFLEKFSSLSMVTGECIFKLYSYMPFSAYNIKV